MVKFQKLDAWKLLADVPDEYAFRCHDGGVFKNMRELRDGLEAISDETFGFHANAEKNDFSNWVKDIINDEKLARDLTKSHSRLQAAKSVAARVSSLSTKLKPMTA
ncbi:MAG TPA: hypothetical protein G4O17_01885 [Dehalococcoidia bacterium]|nr:hypothetical protein [Dehalococcoidia bacterium]